MSATAREIISQPALWAWARDHAAQVRPSLAGSGRSLMIGCGTSAFMSQVIARLREEAGFGVTDWAFASEALPRRYDHLVAISRSATTTEVLDALGRFGDVGHRVGVTAVGPPVADRFDSLVDHVVRLTPADEESVVQTRFPTTLLALTRAAFGDSTDLVVHAETALAADLPDVAAIDHLVFLGTGWTLGLAHEAALKVREMAQAWSESHLALDYRHGPIAVAGPRSLVFVFGSPPAGLLGDLRATGAQVWCDPDLDPLGQLVVAQRIGLALCENRGLDPDHPTRLTRSVVLG